ncbi:MAG: galactokinase family protein [Candidatus Shapirobacteria bacterium]|jgi:galactokinase
MGRIERIIENVSVPGRICLAGENIDWISGPVLTMAVNDLRTSVGIISKTENNVSVRYQHLPLINDQFKIATNYRYGRDSIDYVKSVVSTLRKSNYNISGMELRIQSNLSTSGGLASSGSFCVALVAAMNQHFELGLDNEKIAEMAYVAEKEEMGIGCGQMDQYAVSLGGFLYLNCSTRPPEIQKLNSNEKVVVVIGDTGKSMRFSKVGEELKKRLEKNDPSLREYIVKTEEAIQRIRKLLMVKGWNPEEVGNIINQCHEYIKIYKGINNPVIESYIEAARENGAYCAKTSGARSVGGCMFALCSRENSNNITNSIIKLGGIASVTSVADIGIRYNKLHDKFIA